MTAISQRMWHSPSRLQLLAAEAGLDEHELRAYLWAEINQRERVRARAASHGRVCVPDPGEDERIWMESIPEPALDRLLADVSAAGPQVTLRHPAGSGERAVGPPS